MLLKKYYIIALVCYSTIYTVTSKISLLQRPDASVQNVAVAPATTQPAVTNTKASIIQPPSPSTATSMTSIIPVVQPSIQSVVTQPVQTTGLVTAQQTLPQPPPVAVQSTNNVTSVVNAQTPPVSESSAKVTQPLVTITTAASAHQPVASSMATSQQPGVSGVKKTWKDYFNGLPPTTSVQNNPASESLQVNRLRPSI